MAIAFNQIPDDLRVPLFLAEVNAGPPVYSSVSRMLLIGRADPDLVEPLTLINVGSTDPSELFGYGTMLADMVAYARQINKMGEIYAIALPEAENSVQAEGSVTFTGTAKANGRFYLYICGEKYGIQVRQGDTAAVVASRFKECVQKGYRKFGMRFGPPVMARIDGAAPTVVKLKARHAGVEGNDINVKRAWDGDPARVRGISVAVSNVTGGSGGGGIGDALAVVAAERFDWIASPYSGKPAIDTVSDFMRTRWDPFTQLDGHYITARNGTLASLTADGLQYNDPHVTILGTYQVPQPSWCIAASLCAQVAFTKNLGRSVDTAVEIARPMQGLTLYGITPPRDSLAVFTPVERETLLRSGISTFTFGADDQMRCERIITTYRENGADLLDTTFLDIESVCVASYVKRYMKNAVLGLYPRHVMREDNPNGVQGVVTPDQMRATVIHAYDELAAAGIVRQEDEFAEYLRVEFDYDNDRAGFYMPVAQAAALRVFAVNITMFKSLTAASALL